MGQLLSWQKEQLGGPQSHNQATGQSEIKVGETFASMSIWFDLDNKMKKETKTETT